MNVLDEFLTPHPPHPSLSVQFILFSFAPFGRIDRGLSPYGLHTADPRVWPFGRGRFGRGVEGWRGCG